MMATVDLEMADLFSDTDDIDELIDNHGAEDERGEEGEEENMQAGGQETGLPDKEDPGNIDLPSAEPKKKRVVKNPQPKLNPDRLCGPRGLAIIEDMFKDTKFRGKGYEKEDLAVVMKKLEHWAHRLFPKLPFDDCLEKIEKLGTKKPVQTHVKKIRMGMNVLHEQFQKDSLLQVEQSEEPALQQVEEDVFDELLREHASSRAAVPTLPPVNIPITPVELSEEQHQRIIHNRQLAEERRQARLLAQQEQQLNRPEGISLVQQGTAVDNMQTLQQTGTDSSLQASESLYTDGFRPNQVDESLETAIIEEQDTDTFKKNSQNIEADIIKQGRVGTSVPASKSFDAGVTEQPRADVSSVEGRECNKMNVTVLQEEIPSAGRMQFAPVTSTEPQQTRGKQDFLKERESNCPALVVASGEGVEGHTLVQREDNGVFGGTDELSSTNRNKGEVEIGNAEQNHVSVTVTPQILEDHLGTELQSQNQPFPGNMKGCTEPEDENNADRMLILLHDDEKLEV